MYMFIASIQTRHVDLSLISELLGHSSESYRFGLIFSSVLKFIAKKSQVAQFANTNSNFSKIAYSKHASSYNVYEYQFSAKSA